MPVVPTYPGVYVEELPSGVRTITGVSTALTAFVGRAPKGEFNKPVTINNFADFERNFGGLWQPSQMTFAVQDYFLNGGSQAIIVRVPDTAVPATAAIGALTLQARMAGSAANRMTAQLIKESETHLTLKLLEGGKELEAYRNVALADLAETLEAKSRRIGIDGEAPSQVPESASVNFASGDDGGVQSGALPGSESNKTGLYALEDENNYFSLVCIPGADAATMTAASVYCEKRRALLILDAPGSWDSKERAKTGVGDLGTSKNAAVFFPHLKKRNPLKQNAVESFPPCGAVAGLFARTDASRGIWKAPAGTEAGLVGVVEPSVSLTDAETGELNPLGINCIRAMPPYGTVVWGARTLQGNDQLASEWKYVPVRRIALYIEESLFRGTQWVVFEPNDEPLWSQIRLNIGAFMHDLFRQGAFQGSSPKEAYFVKCDHETTTQTDIDKGIVNVMVGFAPLKPAEFVILQFQQIAGQV